MDIMGQTLVYNIVAVYACMYILYGVFWLEYYCSRDQPCRTPHGVRTMNLQPPTPFSFGKSEECLKWKRHFEQYHEASGLAEKGEQRQVSTLLHCLGEEAEEVLDTTHISGDDRKKYEKVIDEFDKYFKVKKNVIYERTRFNQHSRFWMSQQTISSWKYTD